ncbi:MAG: NADH-quinone oxidoreductase subunit H [Cytophagaceae bacterium]|nr:NADH-quinone oxidoreductase subunit H [Cytophagaceae bacterium]
MLPILLIFIASIFFVGILNQTKAVSSGRRGASLVQPINDILRLLKKSTVYSTDTSFIFKLAPSVYFAAIVCAILLLPLGPFSGLLSFEGDFIFFAYILALGKFFAIIGALDTGSSFEGMGANREALYSMLAEPAFFVLLGSFAMLTGHTTFQDIYQNIHFGTYESYLLAAIATYLLVQIAMVENSRLPFDDPKTHLELTMVHEVMILDNSGFDLGMILYGNSLKFVMYGTLIANFFLPPTLPAPLAILVFFVVQAAFAVLAGLLESFRARNRMKSNPQGVFVLTSLAILIFFGVLIMMNKFSL